MRRASFTLLIVGMFALGGSIVGQDKKETKKEEPAKTSKGSLPQGWGKANLGLTEDQKSKILAADSKYDGEIEALTKKIAELRKKKKEDQVAVLTAEQKKKLEDYVKENAGIPK